MKKILTTVLVIALAATFINDVGRYARARYELSVVGQDTADRIALSGKDNSRDKNATAAAQYAAAQGATVYLYDQDDQKVHLWVEMPVSDTWLWHRVAALQNGEPQTAPFMAQTEKTARWK